MFAVGFVVIIALAFFILSVLLFNGKASMLLAGYNSMSKKEKARYVKKNYVEVLALLLLLSL
ncbi:DUF3784 domain-containing protein [Clostridioides difficile]|uniref:DUF3784 domain-containing protein n=1 Tax=Clostridioides difficile TaxID=1496 RepID=UPI002FD2CFE7